MALRPPFPLPRLLFVLKYREGYWGPSGSGGPYDLSSGLLNSVTFIVQMLLDMGIAAKIVQVVDNNHIYTEINTFQPTHVIAEAFWVVPEKFDVLMKLYPAVNWAVRNHSEIPFLQHEGISMEWLYGYLSRGIEIMNNSPRAVEDVRAIALAYGGYDGLVSYAPNYYPLPPLDALPLHVPNPRRINPRPRRADDTIRIGCFGSIRPLKNQLIQAVSAVRYAALIGRKLEFHINGSRVEQFGETIVRNLRAFFSHTPRATLVTHAWMSHEEFLNVMSSMDISMQVSHSETFNIVSADAVSLMVPVVASPEVTWLGPYAHAEPNDGNSIVQNLLTVDRQVKHQPHNNRLLWQYRDLLKYTDETRRIWWDRFGGHGHHPERRQ